MKQLQGELELYREQAASGEAGSQALKAELEQLEITAGLTDVEGPGVTIILEDSSQANVTGNEADYLIHDNDLLSVINELRSAGAEAISLNGERILATSEVRCTGAVVTVNGRRLVLHLAKGQNPIACSQACSNARECPGKKAVLLFLDDAHDAAHSVENTAWLYDTDFEFLNSPDILQVVAAGPGTGMCMCGC